MTSKPIAAPSRTKEILKKYDLHTKKGYGQNFLIDPNAAAKIASGGTEEQGILEIGPGIGSLTEQLAQRYHRVTAVEIDDRLISLLREELSEYDNIQIVHSDFLKLDVEEVCRNMLEEGCSEICVAANLPYYITTPVLFRLFEAAYCFPRITVMVQKEVADRFAAQPGSAEYSSLSVEAQYLYDVKKLFTVPAASFFPAPNVDSAVVSFQRKQKETVLNHADFFAFVKACFRQRRKTLANNLKEYLNMSSENLFKEAGLSEGIRAQQLTVDDFVRLYALIQGEKK